MNKKLISKCCHSEVSESVYFTCLKCGQVCEVIEIEENSFLKECDDLVKSIDGVKTPTPSDTFIEGIIKKFREQFVASDNRFLTGTETVGKAEKFIRQSFKYSLQEQRQSILEEIDKNMNNEKNELKNQVKDILNKYFKEALKNNILKYEIEKGWLTIEFMNNLTSEGKDFNFKLLCAQSIADYINKMGYIDELALINRITLMLAESLRSANQDVNILMTEEK